MCQLTMLHKRRHLISVNSDISNTVTDEVIWNGVVTKCGLTWRAAARRLASLGFASAVGGSSLRGARFVAQDLPRRLTNSSVERLQRKGFV